MSVCKNHPDRSATVRCSTCGHTFCADCLLTMGEQVSCVGCKVPGSTPVTPEAPSAPVAEQPDAAPPTEAPAPCCAGGTLVGRALRVGVSVSSLVVCLVLGVLLVSRVGGNCCESPKGSDLELHKGTGITLSVEDGARAVYEAQMAYQKDVGHFASDMSTLAPYLQGKLPTDVSYELRLSAEGERFMVCGRDREGQPFCFSQQSFED